MKEKMFYDAPGAAKFIGYSIRHLMRLVHRNEIPYFVIKEKHFFQARDLKKLPIYGRKTLSR